jgi:hypothetical protein
LRRQIRTPVYFTGGIGMGKTCSTIKELRDKVALHYGKEPVQLTLYLPKNKEAAN